MRRSNSRVKGMGCLCAAVRRTGRLLTRRYDEALRPTGMNAAQFELMNTVYAAQPVNQISLAKILEADQTTLSRNLKLLLEMEWIETSIDAKDGRRRSYRVTAKGLSVLQEATRCWSRINKEMEALLGMSGTEVWLTLDRVMDAVRGKSGV